MRLRIKSDGYPASTRVETEDGQAIEGVTRVAWEIDGDTMAIVHLRVVGVALDVVGHLANEPRRDAETSA